MTLRILTIIGFILLVDFVLFLVFIRVFANIFLRKTLEWVHAAIASLFICFTIILLMITKDPGENYRLYRNYFLWMDVFLIIYLPKLILLITLSPLLLFRFGRRPGRIHKSIHRIGLQKKYLWIAAAFFVTTLVFFVTFDGIVRGASKFTVRKVDLEFKNLPPSFDGFTIAQFSDIHLGSWYHKENVINALKLLQQQNANIIVFTGDLINVNAEELKGYDSIFRSLSALGGKYAIIGNHDLGDFARLNRGQNLGAQLPAIEKFYSDQHFTLLRNENKVIHKKNDSIIIAGVDNWSQSHFKKYGNLSEALKGLDNHPFTILLSHDPSHWKAEILEKSTVDLTLSGHTHGGQMGFNLFGIQWSPIMYRYPEWDGLYESTGRFLYVNPGLGFLGFSGRIGINPEITLIRLKRQ